MATQRQIRANRANAARSTGPRSAAGRARSAANATPHPKPTTARELSTIVATLYGNAALLPMKPAKAAGLCRGRGSAPLLWLGRWGIPSCRSTRRWPARPGARGLRQGTRGAR